MLDYLHRLLAKDAVRRVVRTFVITFLGILVPGSLGWLHDLTAWANNQGQTPFPDAHGLVYLLVSAIGAAVLAVVNAIWLTVENATGKGFLRTVTPTVTKKRAPRAQKGSAELKQLMFVCGQLTMVVALMITAEILR